MIIEQNHTNVRQMPTAISFLWVYYSNLCIKPRSKKHMKIENGYYFILHVFLTIFCRCNMVDGSGVINLSSLKSASIASNFVGCNGDYCYPSCYPEVLEANVITCTMMGTMAYFSFTPVTSFSYQELTGLAVIVYLYIR